MNPLVSFITVNYKTPHLYRHLLKGLAEARPAFPYELFFVDNDSRDGSPDMVREKYPWAKVLASERNRGLGGGLNMALGQAQGKYVCYLNPDLTIFSGELDRWVEWMEQHPEVGVSGPRIVSPDNTDQDSCYRFPGLLTPLLRRTVLGKLSVAKPHLEKYLMKGLNREVEQEVDWVLGAAFLIRREILEQLGRFDERFFLYFEDTDLCRRVWSAGHKVMYTPVARFVHYHQRESRTRHFWDVAFNKMARIHILSGLKYFWKYRGQKNPRA
jgi:GT2 family glycosyltransferase